MTTILQKSGCKGNILVVDDEPDNLEVLSIILESEGYQVRQALNANIAFKTIELQVPELIILDIRMPEIDGYEVCELLKSRLNTKDIPVIFLSGLSRDIDKNKGIKIGGVDFLTKPFMLEEVLAKVEHHLTIRRLEIKVEQRKHELKQQSYQYIENKSKRFKASSKARDRKLQVTVCELQNMQPH